MGNVCTSQKQEIAYEPLNATSRLPATLNAPAGAVDPSQKIDSPQKDAPSQENTSSPPQTAITPHNQAFERPSVKETQVVGSRSADANSNEGRAQPVQAPGQLDKSLQAGGTPTLM